MPITVDGQKKYNSLDGLFDIKGLEGSGTTAAELAVRKFTKFQVRAIPTVAAADLESAFRTIQTELAETPLFDEVNTFASAVAGEMKQRALLAIVVSIFAICHLHLVSISESGVRPGSDCGTGARRSRGTWESLRWPAI